MNILHEDGKNFNERFNLYAKYIVYNSLHFNFSSILLLLTLNSNYSVLQM